jgi:SAM-dependent methyltransferase
MEPIDAVYLWIDGAAPGTRERLAAALARNPPELPDGCAESLFRDHGELRSSLRSLERFAPWVRHVHLVTDGERPAWLDTSNPRLSLVSHEQIFADASCLPSFNSDAISLQLHRIPGLTRHFLLFNDDCLLGQETTPEHFLLADGRPVLYLDDIEVPRALHAGPVHDRGLAYTRRLLEGWLGKQAVIRMFAHTPQLYDRELLEALERLWASEFRRTSAMTFRSLRGIVLRLLYPAAALAGAANCRPAIARLLSSGSREYSLVRLKPRPLGVLRDLSYVARHRPRFICVNDELGSGTVARQLGSCLQLALERMYPEPSSFELGGGAGASNRDGRVRSRGTAAADARLAFDLGSGSPAAVDPFAARYWNRRLVLNWNHRGVGSLVYGEGFNAWRNRVRIKVFRRVIRDLAPDPSATRVLEVGAGTGLHLREWLRLGVRQLVAVDIAEAAVQRLRAQFPGVAVHRCDVGGPSLPFADGSFEIACALGVLFHIVDDDRYRRALANLSRVIAPGGHLLLTESPLRAGERRFGRYWAARSDEFVESALVDANLEPVARRPEVALTSPPLRLGPAWTALWERLMQPLQGRERIGWAVGAAAYPFERALTAVLRRGPSTHFLVCRKRAEAPTEGTCRRRHGRGTAAAPGAAAPA